MVTAEKQTFNTPDISPEQDYVQEHLAGHGEGSLRDKLLSNESSRAWAHIPRGTVAVEMNSHTLGVEDMFTASDTVTRLREQPTGRPSSEEGAKRFSLGKSMLSMNMDINRRRENGKTEANVTLLYDEGAELTGEDKLHIPSAVLVHEAMTPEDIAKLRETLPPGVPILDAKTNELLDDVGAAEREKGSWTLKMKRDFGRTAFSGLDFDSLDREIEEMYWNKSQERAEDSERLEHLTQRQLFDMQQEAFRRNGSIIHTATPGTEEYATMQSHVSPWATEEFIKKNGSKAASESQAEARTETPIPESEEVRAHREEQEEKARVRREKAEAAAVYDEAKAENNARNTMRAVEVIKDKAEDLYGTSNLTQLDDEQVRKVERETRKELHPDKGYAAGGDTAATQQAADLFDKFRRSREAGDNPPPPDNT